MDAIAKTVAQALLEIDAVKFTPDDPKTFKSGIQSPVYIDNRTIPYFPEQWRRIIASFQDAIAEHNLSFDIVAGIAVAGVPHSAALAYATEYPSVFIRKESKDHGLKNRIEGGDVSGKTVLLIEDLVTTGGSSLDGVVELREAGATVQHAMAIVSYGFAEAASAYQATGVDLITLTTFDIILTEASARGIFNSEAVAIIRRWLDNPHDWEPTS
jgi:orotate phosphoribosyltransferase